MSKTLQQQQQEVLINYDGRFYGDIDIDTIRELLNEITVATWEAARHATMLSLQVYEDGWNDALKAVEKGVPEEGIAWMQEGHNKDRKGFTAGFNASRAAVLSVIKSLKK